jgi:copper chaperone CopZ
VESQRAFVLEIEGMHCGGCVRRVTQALQQIPGVQVDKVEIGRAEGTVEPAVEIAELHRAVGALGFSVKET